MGAQQPSARASDSGARGPGFEPQGHRVVSLSTTLQPPQNTGEYPGSGGSIPT